MKDELAAAAAFAFMGFFMGMGFWGSKKVTNKVDDWLISQDKEVQALKERLKKAREAEQGTK